MAKKMTDEQLETMGRNLAEMHRLSIATWEIALATMPINSAQYRQVCAAGRKVQALYWSLESEAERREWDTAKMREVFSSRVACQFS